jgi:hypothetical protein
MRITVPVVLLLFAVSGATAQTPSASSAIASEVAAAPLAPLPSQPVAGPMTPAAQATTQGASQAEPTSAVVQATTQAEEATQAEAATDRAQVATTTQDSEMQDEPKRSRVLWVLVGVVIVLGVIVLAR